MINDENKNVRYQDNQAFSPSENNTTGIHINSVDKGKSEMEMQTIVVTMPKNGSSPPVANRERLNNGCGCLQGILAVLLVAVLIALVVVVVLYAKEKRDSDKESDSGSQPCLEEHCVANAAALLGYINRSADPCQDFYNFACGGWQQKTMMPTTSTQVHIMWSLNEQNYKLVRNLLGDPKLKDKYSKYHAVTKAIDFYQACLSKNAINQQKDTYLKVVIRRLGGANLTTDSWNSTTFDVNEAMQKTFGQLGVQPLFGLNVYADFINSSIRRMAIVSGGLGLANTFYVEKNSTEVLYSKTRQAYKEYMVDVMTLVGANRTEAERQMQDVYLFEEKIAHVIQRKMRNPPAMTTIKSLTNQTKFDWLSFFAGIAANYSYTLTENETILHRTNGVVQDIMDIVNNTDKAILSNYFVWTVIRDVIDHLPGEYGEAHLQYQKKIHGETYDAKQRWKTCLEATQKGFPMPLGLIFVDKTLNPQAKERAKEIFEEIRREFVRELSTQTWMDEETRKKAEEKAETSTILVGYPEYIKDEVKLNKKYQQINVEKDNYLKSIFSIKSFLLQSKLADLKHPVDRNVFEQSPMGVNAYHYLQENKNIFLAGILQAPFYHENNLRATNYGGIGMIAGHELTHGFDHQGRQFDKNGNMANWWSQSSSQEYKNKSDCMRKQYSEYKYYDRNVNGQTTLGENIADNGGVKFAFEAYKRSVEKYGEEKRLPGVDYTPYQLFFISYAQGWCSKYTRAGALTQLDNLPWPTMNIRVEGAVKNSEEFAKAFKCKLGSPMNPKKKCSVW